MSGARFRLPPSIPTTCLLVALTVSCGDDRDGVRDTSDSEGASQKDRFSRVFVDVTAQAGIDFVHVTGGTGDKLLPETLGSGAAFLDFDGDDNLDVFIVNSRHWTGDEPQPAPPPACRLYRGNGDGSFVDVTEAAGAAVSVYGMGCSIADYDADGDADIYLTALGDNVLLRNDEGKFRDVTSNAGVAGGHWTDETGTSHPEWSTASAWGDLDRDGDLDLFVANYVQWSPRHEVFTTLDGATKAFTTPDRYKGLPCRLFLNDGTGKFEDGSGVAGLLGVEGKSLGVALHDLDNDGLVDVVVANDTRPDFLFVNLGDGRFEERGLELGIAYDESGRARAGMGVDIAIYTDDGAPSVAIGNFSEEPMSLWRRRPDGSFASRTDVAGLSVATHGPLAFAVSFLDADLDGRLDLLVVNGHIEPDISAAVPSQAYAQSSQLFRGLGGEAFDDVTRFAGRDFAQARVGRGLAYGDMDRDGDLDLLVTTNGGPAALLRNDAVSEAGHPHFLRVRLVGKGGNLDAIGSRVTLESGGRRQVRHVKTGSSYLSQSETTLTFGLGSEVKVDRLTVRWPTGAESEHEVPGVDRTLEIHER